MNKMDPDRAIGVTEFFDSAPCFAAIVDREFTIESANFCFCNIFSESSGQSCYQACKDQDRPCEVCPAAEVFEDGNPHESEQQGVTREGRAISYNVKAVPLYAQDGAVERVLLVGLETTALVELRQELKQSDQLATVGLTTASLAHTIKNILAGLDGAIYAVDSGLEKDDGDRVKSGWEMAKGYVEQVNSLLKNLLNYAQNPEPNREKVEPHELVQEIVQLHAGKAGLADVELQASVAEGLPSVLLDRHVIHACLSNLVQNAIDACMWDPDQEKEHRIVITGSSAGNGRVAFEVVDNGTGIPEENQVKLFKAVFTTKGMRGTGLGLLLTKKAMQNHGGKVSFTSTPGQGTTFRLEL